MNLAHIIDRHAADSAALIFDGDSITYGELRDEVGRMRGGLASIGVAKGDRVALLLGNSRQFVVAYLATIGLGAVAVPLNPYSPGPELELQLTTVGATVVLIGEAGAASWTNADRLQIPLVMHVISDAPNAFAEQTVGNLDELLAGEPVACLDVNPDDIAVHMFTSGTAGSPKAAMLSHGNLASNIQQSNSADGHVDADDVIYGVLPLFHIFGLNVVVGVGLSAGAAIVLATRFEPSAAVTSIRDHGVTVVPGAPAIWAAFSQLDELEPDAFAAVRLALSGASRLPVSVARSMSERFGVAIREGYGLTETSPIVCTSVGITPRFGSVGRVLNGVEVRLVNDNGEALIGDVGEVWVRGDNVFLGYYNDPDATAAVLTEDGWLKTGDMATVDDDGYLYLVDRSKDLIIVSGFNVYPAEVEEVLAMHAAVRETAVVGVPNYPTGEAVKAFVVATAGAEISEAMLIEHALDHLASYKCPTQVVFVDQLPRNATGKILRRNLDAASVVGPATQ